MECNNFLWNLYLNHLLMKQVFIFLILQEFDHELKMKLWAHQAIDHLLQYYFI